MNKTDIDDLSIAFQELKKYSFHDKMGFCFNHAINIMAVDRLELFQDNEVYPWELEYLTELCLLGMEEKNSEPIDTTVLVEVVNTIRYYYHSRFNEKDDALVSDMLMVLATTQFKPQENYYHRLFRSWYYFSFENKDISVKEEFKKTFGCDYYDFIDLAVLVRFYLSKEITSHIRKDGITPIMNTVLSPYEHVISQLLITREQYLDDQNEKNKGKLENGFYGLNMLYVYPFVSYRSELFLPLPYLVIDAVTDSLLNRLTDGNNSLRTDLGKHTAENYLCYLMREGNLYDEVYREQEYWKRKNSFLSPDVLVRSGDKVCLLESKLSSPRISLRWFCKEDIDRALLLYAEYVVQMYRGIKDFDLYNPFDKSVSISDKNIFGIVVVHTDSFIRRNRIYVEALKSLKIDEMCDEANFLRSHIMIVPISDIESYALYSDSLFPAIDERLNEPETWNGFKLPDKTKETQCDNEMLPAYATFIDQTEKIIDASVINLEKEGLLKTI